MNWDEVVREIDSKVFQKTNRHLKDVENIVLHGAWQGKTYEQMQESCQDKYSLSYLKQAAGPRLWKLLSEILEEDIGKTNFRVVLERQWNKQPRFKSQDRRVSSPRKASAEDRQQDWGDAPEITVFYGRDRELELLEQWIIKDRSRLVTVFGLGGVGKTSLLIHLAKQIQARFDVVIWRSLHYVPDATKLLDNLLEFFGSGSNETVNENLDSKISAIIEHLRRNRCLVVLDTAAEIWLNGNLAAQYRQQYRGYGELFRRIGVESHQSCLLLCTRDKPKEVVRLEETASVHSLHLEGLASAAEDILREKQLSDSECWSELIRLYRGNPLVLKIVATTIAELFGGSVRAFLQQDTIVFGDVYDLLDEQFERLSILEREILIWLAIAHNPLSLIQLQAYILLPTNTAESIAALESSIRRSLIVRNQVKGETVFSLHQPVIVQYLINRSINWIGEEIERSHETQDFTRIKFLRNYALAIDSEEVQKQQIEQIVTPLISKLYRIFGDESAVKVCLQKILASLKDKTPLVVGYTKQNIEILLEQLQLDLNN